MRWQPKRCRGHERGDETSEWHETAIDDCSPYITGWYKGAKLKAEEVSQIHVGKEG